MEPDLFKIASEVNDEKSFIDFIALLAKDSSSLSAAPDSNDWENGTIESFLEAATSWAEATMENHEFYSRPENSWSRAAQIICSGKSYE